MSNWNGLVRFTDGQIFYFEYNGTSDVCLPPLRNSFEEVTAHWREEPERWDCICPSTALHQPVEIVISYGMCWTGLACRQCQTIVGDLTPPTETEFHRPDWAANILRTAFPPTSAQVLKAQREKRTLRK